MGIRFSTRAPEPDAVIERDDFAAQDIEFHRATASSYDTETTTTYSVYHRLLLEPYLDRLAEQLGPNERVLDLGCGTGVVSLALARRGFAVLGVDHSKDMLLIAEKKLAAAHMLSECRFVAADVRRLPVADGEFACVTCQGVLHHLRELKPCLQEFARALRPGGFFYISEPCEEETPLKRAFRPLWRTLTGRKHSPQSGQVQSVEAPISSAKLREELERVGLEFDMLFLTHMPRLRAALPERLYVLAVRLVSWPWRKRSGDLVFVFGRKPMPAEAS